MSTGFKEPESHRRAHTDRETGYGKKPYHCDECGVQHSGNMSHESTHILYRCPFCCLRPVIGYWHGQGPRCRIVQCDNNKCLVNPSVVGTTAKDASERWNWRGTAS